MALFDIFKKTTKDISDCDKSVISSKNKLTTSLSQSSTDTILRDNSYVVHNDSLSGEKLENWPQKGCTIEKLKLMKNITIVVDSSFIKNMDFATFINKWEVTNYKKIVLIPSFEVKKLNTDELSLLSNEEIVEYLCDNYSSFFDELISKGKKENIVFLTSDAKIGLSVQNIAREKDFRLRWYGINNEGKLILLFVNNQEYSENNYKKSKEKNYQRPYKRTNEIVKISKNINPVKIVPIAGKKTITRNSRTSIILKEAVMTDHSSITYSTYNSNYFAKIYTANALQLDFWENKAKRMLQNIVEIPGVCWPIDILDDSDGNFVGVLLPASKGVQLTKSVFKGTTGLSQYFSDWNKKDLCELTITILNKIIQIHRLGLFFGCFNPATIYINNASEVYFVDTDGWQIEGFPAISKNQTFMPPELLRENKSELFYTIDQENYQIAVLSFMLMMPGKFPYSKNKGSDECEGIKNMLFPFSVGGGMRRSSESERPSGVWRIVWDHLPYRMCDGFYNTFHSNGKYSNPGMRLKVQDWLKMVEEFYENLTASPKTDSIHIFPRTYRRDVKRNFVKCEVCGQEHPDFYFLHKIRIQQQVINIWDKGYRVCLPCANDQSNISFKCQCCGREFFYTNKTKIVHEIGKKDFDWNEQRWCRDCKKRTVKCNNCKRDTPIYQIKEFEDRRRNLRTSVCGDCFGLMIEKAKREREEWRNEVHSWRKCRDCGRTFSITNGDNDFYSKKGFDLPVRCPNCRSRRY